MSAASLPVPFRSFQLCVAVTAVGFVVGETERGLLATEIVAHLWCVCGKDLKMGKKEFHNCFISIPFHIIPPYGVVPSIIRRNSLYFPFTFFFCLLKLSMPLNPYGKKEGAWPAAASST